MRKKNRHASFRGCVPIPFYYMLLLNHLDTLFSFSSINHDFLEDDGWVVRSEGEAVDAAALESAITVADVVSKNEDEAAPKKETREEKKARKAALKAEKKAKKEKEEKK